MHSGAPVNEGPTLDAHHALGLLLEEQTWDDHLQHKSNSSRCICLRHIFGSTNLEATSCKKVYWFWSFLISFDLAIWNHIYNRVQALQMLVTKSTTFCSFSANLSYLENISCKITKCNWHSEQLTSSFEHASVYFDKLGLLLLVWLFHCRFRYFTNYLL